MSTKQSSFKVGQTVKSAWHGSRKITAIKGKYIYWKAGKRTGKCTSKSLQSWKYRMD